MESHEHRAHRHGPAEHAEAAGADAYFTEVPVHAGVLLATTATLELLHGFFATEDPALRGRLGRYRTARYPDDDTGGRTMQANLLLHELAEAADLLRSLATGSAGEAPT